MDEKIEQLISLAGNEHRYQYFILFLVIFLWMNCNFLSCVLPFIEREPIVNYTDSKGIFHENEILTSDICIDLNANNFTIVKSYGYSWVSEFQIECNKTEVSNVGSFVFIGNTLAGFIFSFISKLLSHKKIIIISSFIFCITIFICTLIKSFDYFYILLISEAINCLSANSLVYSCLLISQETVSSKKRSLFSSIMGIGYSLCGIVYTLFFLLLEDWRKVFYVLIGLSALGLIITWIFVYNSPRVYINNNNYEKVNKILEGIAKFNGKLESFRESLKQDIYKNIMEDLKNSQEESKKSPKKEYNKETINIYKENESYQEPFIKTNDEPQCKYIF